MDKDGRVLTDSLMVRDVSGCFGEFRLVLHASDDGFFDDLVQLVIQGSFVAIALPLATCLIVPETLRVMCQMADSLSVTAANGTHKTDIPMDATHIEQLRQTQACQMVLAYVIACI